MTPLHFVSVMKDSPIIIWEYGIPRGTGQVPLPQDAIRNDGFDLQRGVVVNSRWSSTNAEVYRDAPFVHHCWGTFWASSIVEHGAKRGPTTDKDSFEIFWNKNKYLSYAKEVQSILKLQNLREIMRIWTTCPCLLCPDFFTKKVLVIELDSRGERCLHPGTLSRNWGADDLKILHSRFFECRCWYLQENPKNAPNVWIINSPNVW